MSRLLITGASGFIGRACLAQAVADGWRDVHAVSRRPQDNEDATWHQADLLDHRQIEKLIQTVTPTHILHTAWEVTPRIYSTSPANKDWLEASRHMADIFGENGGQYFLGLGTSAEYKPEDTPCRESETAIAPTTIYGQSKADFQRSLFEYADHHHYKAGWLRVFVPYGPGDPAQRLIPHLLAKMAAGEDIETTHGRQQRDFIHVHDIAQIACRMLSRGTAGIFNAGSGKGIAIRDIITHLANRFDALDHVKFDAIPLADTEPMMLVADMRKINEILGFTPQTNLFAALDQLATPYLTTAQKKAQGLS